MNAESGPSRSYLMGRRAELAAETGERILDAAVQLFMVRSYDQLTLAAVAERAGVTVQTVIRRFGDKEGMAAAAVARASMQIEDQRGLAPVGDVAGAVDNLMEHYESQGGLSLRLLAEEGASATIAEVTRTARAVHRAWCLRVFAPWLSGPAAPSGVDRDRLLAQLVTVCDVYTWKLLRQDAGLSRRQVNLALREFLDPLLEPHVDPPAGRLGVPSTGTR